MPAQPYLSIVVTSRNDDHGGSLLRRMQTFVNALCQQSARFDLPVELIVVEWNPTPDRPPLAEAIDWSAARPPLDVRIVQAPAEVHRRYRHAEALPLYQMLAKNVGIRRARGEFILAANIDVLFSMELFAWLAERALDPGRMYRANRLDTAADVPVEAEAEERLEYCANHLLRLNLREGTYPCTPDGLRLPDTGDIVDSRGAVHLGQGWYDLEGPEDRRFRWAGDPADLWIVRAPPGLLELDLAPGPGAGAPPCVLRAGGPAGMASAEVTIRGRSRVRIRMTPAPGERFRLRLTAPGGGLHVPGSDDHRALNLQVFRIAWIQHPDGQAELRSKTPKIEASAAPRSAALDWFAKLARPAGAALSRNRHGLSGGQRRTPETGLRAWKLHTNACGDFTLLSRRAWFDLRGYPEFDWYSMNIDSVFCFAAHFAGYREYLLEEPLRVYHIEHSAGSGFTPENEQDLRRRIGAAGIPWLEAHQAVAWASQMWRLNSPIIFNRSNWGLRDEGLPETAVCHKFPAIESR